MDSLDKSTENSADPYCNVNAPVLNFRRLSDYQELQSVRLWATDSLRASVTKA